MNNFDVLKKVLLARGIEFGDIGSANNAVWAEFAGKREFFITCYTPFGNQGEARLCKDKDYFYRWTENVIRQPKTLAFFAVSYKEVLAKAEAEFSYPFIIKMNQGQAGTHVYKVGDRDEAVAAIKAVFSSNPSDYVVLAQEYIESLREYRAVVFDGALKFAYEKDNKGAKFVGNLSPLHWEGAKAVLVDDDRAGRLAEFLKPLIDFVEIPFMGLDVIEDKQGRYWFLEANSAPGFEYFLEVDGAAELLYKLYDEMVDKLSA